jgi:hypothetical protein
MHCSKALMRSSFWDGNNFLSPKDLPTISKVINDQINASDDEKSHMEEEQRYKDQIENFG